VGETSCASNSPTKQSHWNSNENYFWVLLSMSWGVKIFFCFWTSSRRNRIMIDLENTHIWCPFTSQKGPSQGFGVTKVFRKLNYNSDNFFGNKKSSIILLRKNLPPKLGENAWTWVMRERKKLTTFGAQIFCAIFCQLIDPLKNFCFFRVQFLKFDFVFSKWTSRYLSLSSND